MHSGTAADLHLARIATSGQPVEALEGETTPGAILALPGLNLAFTFADALSVSQDRKGTLNADAAAPGTAFLRADYLPEPGRTVSP